MRAVLPRPGEVSTDLSTDPSTATSAGFHMVDAGGRPIPADSWLIQG